jgi:uncharacterized protein
MDPKLLDSLRSTYDFKRTTQTLTLGAPVQSGECAPEPLVSIPLSMMNRHGLIAGATGTGKTRTLQLLADQLSLAGVPVFLSDVKGDLSGMGAPGGADDRISRRVAETGYAWTPRACPVEFLSLTGASGARLRATVSSFGPLLLSKVLALNETQSSALALLFEFCDRRTLPLLDLSDLRAVLKYLGGDGAAELKELGGMSRATIGVLLRKLVEIEQQGAGDFFGEPEFDLSDLLEVRTVETEPAAGAGTSGGLVSILELGDARDRPALSSTFMMWLLVRLYNELPEVGDLDKPKLVFFFDEAHLLFDGAGKAFHAAVEQVIRLIRSKGVGIFFVTQSPKDIPPDILAQLGNRVQHALRAFTPDDEKALRAAARTYPKTPFYDVSSTLTGLGTGEALVTVLAPSGVPTQPFATRLVPPSSRMAPLTPDEMAARLRRSEQVRAYADTIDRESAREILASRMASAGAQKPPSRPLPDASSMSGHGTGGAERTTIEEILRSPVARTVAGQVTRGILGAILGAPARRKRRW